MFKELNRDMSNQVFLVDTIDNYMKYDGGISSDTTIVLKWSERIHGFEVILHGCDIIL